MAKPMPIGVDDFAKAKENYYFVDKTKFIRDFCVNVNEKVSHSLMNF